MSGDRVQERERERSALPCKSVILDERERERREKGIEANLRITCWER